MFVAIVPAYNEAKRIGSVVRSLFQHVDAVVVVDDGSVDNTAVIAKDAGAVVLTHELNRGQGAALETGHVYARNIEADYIIHFDGDEQFDVGDIEDALNALKAQKGDVLFGSRFLDKESKLPWFKRYVLFLVARVLSRFVSGLPLRDAHNGFRILNKKALNVIYLTQDGMAHATEIPALVKKHNLTHIEFPVKVTYHEYGQGVGGGMKVIRDLVLGSFVDK